MILALVSSMKRFNPLLAIVPGSAAVVAAGAVLVVQRLRAAWKLERLGAASLESLLNAVDANDPVTGAHVRRVARYALVLADAMGLDERALHNVERIALFHDIGKIDEALFDVIHDDRKLTHEERARIQIHPERGAAVLRPLAAFYPELAEGVLSHHERWDGGGYPRGLKGEAIPLAARIVAIADSFDAITHARRYHRGRDMSEGERLLAEGRATQFDPDLVDLFLSPPVLDRVRAEKRAAAATETRGARRRPKRPHTTVEAPDVSFRWRGSAPSQPEQDHAARVLH